MGQGHNEQNIQTQLFHVRVLHWIGQGVHSITPWIELHFSHLVTLVACPI